MIGRRFRLGGRCVALLVLAPAVGGAQTAAARSARATVESFFTALAREQWDSAAALLDLEQFEPFFKSMVGSVRGAVPPRQMTVDELMATDSTMPRAAAEWQIEQIKKNGGGDPFAYFTSRFAGITTPKELFALTVPAAAARWLEAQDIRTQMRAAWRQEGCSSSDLPQFPATKRRILATTATDDSTAYVVYTDQQLETAGPENLSIGEQVMKVRRMNGGWRIEPRENPMQAMSVGIGFDCPKLKRP